MAVPLGTGGKDAASAGDGDNSAVAAAAGFNEKCDVTLGAPRRDPAAAAVVVGSGSGNQDAHECVVVGGRGPSLETERQERDSSAEDDPALHALADLPKMTMPLNSPVRTRRKR